MIGLKMRFFRLACFLNLRFCLCFCLAVSAALPGCRAGAGQDGQEVVVYCSVDQAIAELIFAEFTRQTGVKVLARYDTEADKTVGLVQRLHAERGSPAADVFWSNEIFHTIRLANEQVLARYNSEVVTNWPRQFTDVGHRWHGFALRGRVIVYNTNRLSGEEAPKTLEDVLSAKWRGRIVMANPEFGTTGGDLASWAVHYGLQRATEILQGLKANEVRLVAGNSTVVSMVAQAQADVGFTDTDDVYAGQRNGWPVAMHPLDQGGDGALAIPNTVALVAGAPHPRQAERMVEFLLSEQVETLLAESDSHNTPIRPALAGRFAEYALPNRLDIDYAGIAEQLPFARRAGEVLR
ncbi:MAG: extracellular solute-binding protein [Planctomycetes bacterium]|nr:extracellular solute-binding protein [Planctomycetota bacterium]